LTLRAKCKFSLLGRSSLAGCSSLRWTCIPSSVQTISKSCFSDCSNLSNLTFESSCHISAFGQFAFHGCVSLQDICIPPKRRRASSGPCRSREFILSSFPVIFSLILLKLARRYLGHESDVTVCKAFEVISVRGFGWNDSVVLVRFEPGCKVSASDVFAVADCSSLRSVQTRLQSCRAPSGFCRLLRLTLWVSANALDALVRARPQTPILFEHECGLEMTTSLSDHHSADLRIPAPWIQDVPPVVC
jgi:hypothetical protein